MSTPIIPSPVPGQYDGLGIMTIQWQCQMIQSWLNAWASARGGVASVVANTKHLWEKLLVADQQPRIVIVSNGEIARGGSNQANTMHRVDRQWIVAVIRGHGFNDELDQGVGKAGTPGYVDPFYRHCQVVRDLCRVLINITEEPPIDYKGMEPIPSIAPYGAAGNVFIDGMAIRFSTANDIPAITSLASDSTFFPQ